MTEKPFPECKVNKCMLWKEGLLRARAVDHICLCVSCAVIKPCLQKPFGLGLFQLDSHTSQSKEVRVGTEAETMKECYLLAYQLACLCHPKIFLPRDGTVHSELGPPISIKKSL